MFFLVLISYLPYAAVTAFTPGPNNFLALHSVSNSGWRKGKNTVLGIGTGFLCVMMLCALFCYELEKYVPALTGIMKYVGAAYILWLAIHVAFSKPTEVGRGRSSFRQGFLLQFANFKIIMYAITVYTGYVLPVSQSAVFLMLHAVSLTVIGVAGVFTWAAAGKLLQKVITKHYKPFNIAMAFILALCAVQMIFN